MVAPSQIFGSREHRAPARPSFRPLAPCSSAQPPLALDSSCSTVFRPPLARQTPMFPPCHPPDSGSVVSFNGFVVPCSSRLRPDIPISLVFSGSFSQPITSPPLFIPPPRPSFPLVALFLVSLPQFSAPSSSVATPPPGRLFLAPRTLQPTLG